MKEIQDLTSLLRGKTPIIVVETHEEQRLLELLKRVASCLYKPLFCWSITTGLSRIDRDMGTQKFNADPGDLLRHIKTTDQEGIYVLCDFHPFLEDAPINVRLIKEIAMEFESSRQTLVLVSHGLEIPPEFQRYCASFSLRLPGRNQLANLIAQEIAEVQNQGMQLTVEPGAAEQLADNLRGVTLDDARRLIHNAIVDDEALTKADLDKVNRAKFQLMNMDGVLRYEYDTRSFADIAGMDALKHWLKLRTPGDSSAERTTQNALTPPKGIMLLGVQGCGKSLAAKAVAGIWHRPLLRLDMAALYNKYIGETEKNLKQALELADLMSPCVLWVDEIEKGISGGSGDEGTSKRILGTLLTWMAERKSDVFLVTTANDIQALPPELIRKGRLDEIFFVDLPDKTSREKILSIHLSRRRISLEPFDLQQLAMVSEGFSGAELEQVVISALYASASQQQGLSQNSLLEELAATRPIAVVMAEKITALRQWASNRAINAHTGS